VSTFSVAEDKRIERFEKLVLESKISNSSYRRKVLTKKGLSSEDVQVKIQSISSEFANCEVIQLNSLSNDRELKSISEAILDVVANGGNYEDYRRAFRESEKDWVVRANGGYIYPKKGSEDAARRLNLIVDEASDCVNEVFDKYPY
jgi:hypothetical protein